MDKEARRLALSEKLHELLGSDEVYFQPPESVHMSYPCIRYKESTTMPTFADNRTYVTFTIYEVMIISRNALEPVVDKIPEEFIYCSAPTKYTADNLYHTVYTIYW